MLGLAHEFYDAEGGCRGRAKYAKLFSHISMGPSDSDKL